MALADKIRKNHEPPTATQQSLRIGRRVIRRVIRRVADEDEPISITNPPRVIHDHDDAIPDDYKEETVITIKEAELRSAMLDGEIIPGAILKRPSA